jgi:hypothetical protein
MDHTGDNAYADGFVILVDGRDMFRLKAIAVGWRIIPSANLSVATKI